MKSRTGFIPLVLVLWIAGSAAAKSQDKNGTAEPRVLIIGVVDKIDTKGKSLTLTHAISLVVHTPNDANAGGTSGGGRSGRSGGGRGGEGNSRGGSGGRTATAPVSSQTRTEYKVVVSPGTVLKEGESEIHWTDLKAGDQLEVTTAKEGAKIEALEIIRVPRDSSRSS